MNTDTDRRRATNKPIVGGVEQFGGAPAPSNKGEDDER